MTHEKLEIGMIAPAQTVAMVGRLARSRLDAQIGRLLAHPHQSGSRINHIYIPSQARKSIVRHPDERAAAEAESKTGPCFRFFC